MKIQQRADTITLACSSNVTHHRWTVLTGPTENHAYPVFGQECDNVQYNGNGADQARGQQQDPLGFGHCC